MTQCPQHSRWRKSTLSAYNGNCVEARASGPATVQVRDSKDPHGPTLTFTRAAWRAFLAEVKTRNG
ncbi:MAG TPA: DUF397 domain-containing protein [Streptosporangiaceae bacterium]|nr:DUF397 domain-containing protein [Streptosporangiaceae bacterium]